LPVGMPALNPVHDRALNSPANQLLSPPHVLLFMSKSATSTGTRDTLQTSLLCPHYVRRRVTGGPSLTQRATDLAVLLNSDPQEPRTPSNPRPPSLSHIMLSDDASHTMAAPTAEVDKLIGAPPLCQRSHLPTLDIPREDGRSQDNQT
jgi:hypothetical protein